MGSFLKTVFASCLGVILATVVGFGLMMLVFGRMADNMNKPVNVKPNTILKLSLDKAIPEKTNNVPVNPRSFETESVLGLHDLVAAIEHASSDDNVKGILLDLKGVQAGRASAKVLREALTDFKKEGKFIIANAEYYSQGTYYLASIADKIYVNPLGGVDFRGFAAQVPFFKDMLDRLGIKMQVYYAGQFKSATEPFRRYNMSDQNKLQVREYLGGMYQLYLEDIAASRGISVAELRRIANEYLLRDAEDALQYKFVDEIAYDDQVIDQLKERLGLDKDKKLTTVSLDDYGKGFKRKKDYGAKDKIAVIFAEGDIVDGSGENGNIGGDKYAKLIRKVRQDKKVKAIVIRVNSPGGSGLASDMIWRELEMAKAEGIPVVASMGDLAASGGYYISCNADSIFAEPNTITGSIGVFGMIPSMEDMLKEKAGITFDTVKIGEFAIGLSPFFDVSEKEGIIIQNSVEEFYEIFLSKVAAGRKMTRNQVHEIAQGRVWTGRKAVSIGLVDAEGNLEDAIASAARLADLDKYRVAEYPTFKQPIEQMIDEIIGNKDMVRTYLMENELGEFYPYYQQLKALKKVKGPQARLPFIVEQY